MRSIFHGPAAKVIRERTGHRQGDFATKCGISPQYLSNIENGHRQPPPDVMLRLAVELGVTLAEITYPAPQPAEVMESA